jgi:hypothetical protein
MTSHFCSSNSLQTIRQSSYSLGIAPSDFFLFGKVKGEVIARFIANDKDFLRQVTAILQKDFQDQLNHICYK